MRSSLGLTLVAAFLMVVAGCDTAPKTHAGKEALVDQAQAAMSTLYAKDPGLKSLVDQSPGYAIFPEIGKGGVIVGGAYGRGIVYQGGVPVGFAEMNQGSVGLQLGGQTYIELVVFRNDAALNRFKSGNFDLGAEASAVALTAGAAAAARTEGGITIFTLPKGGAMFEASVSGQKFNYEPMTDQMKQDMRDKTNVRHDNR